MYTHSLELITNGGTFEADLQFNDGNEPSWRTSDDVEMTIDQTRMIQYILACSTKIYKKYGLVKLKIKEK